MLVISRKTGQKIVINGNITIVVRRIENGRVSLAIDAPKEVRIDRGEVHQQRKGKEAA